MLRDLMVARFLGQTENYSSEVMTAAFVLFRATFLIGRSFIWLYAYS